MRQIRAVARFTALALVGCATGDHVAPAASAVLVSEEWLVEDIDGRGVIDYARTTLTFDEDGRVVGNTACNRYFASYTANGAGLQVGAARVTRRVCVPAAMDQERRFLSTLDVVDSFRIDDTGALLLSAPAGTRITARRTGTPQAAVTYRCADDSIIQVGYPSTGTARLIHDGQSIMMKAVASASASRYAGGGWQWWSKGMDAGTLSPLGEGESIASANGVVCTTP